MKNEVELAASLEHLRIMLSAEMKELRINKLKLTKEEVAKKMGVEVSKVSKIEDSTHNTRIEDILRYLDTLDAEFIVGILTDNFLPTSEAAEKWWDSLDEGKKDE